MNYRQTNHKVELSLMSILLIAWVSMLFSGMVGHQFNNPTWFTPYWLHVVGWFLVGIAFNIKRS